MDRVIARIAARRHGVFSHAEVLAAGGTRSLIRHRLRSGRWDQLYPCVYRLAGVASTFRQQLAAACLAGGPKALASHVAAGALWNIIGLPKPRLEITTPRGHRRPVANVIVHETADLLPMDAARVDGIPVTSPVRTFIDLAGIMTADALEEALDDALRTGLVRLSRLRWRMEALGGRGHRGIGTLRDLVDARMKTGRTADSVLETRLFRLITKAGFPVPVSQYEVKENGRLLARVDYAYPELLIAIEADGFGPHFGNTRWQRDLSRRNDLTERGWRVLHVTAEDLRERPVKVLAMLQAAISSVTSRR